jgi:hypothetical protein
LADDRYTRRVTAVIRLIADDVRDPTDCPDVVRFEVIDHSTRGPGVSYSPDVARAVVAYGVRVQISLQDGGRTLKVFLSDHDDVNAANAERQATRE